MKKKEMLKEMEEYANAVRFNDGRSLDKKFFEIDSRHQAERQLKSLCSKNPIERTIASNKIWNDHLRRIGVRK